MDPQLAAILCMVSMLVFLLMGVPIAFALGFSTVVFGTLAFGPQGTRKDGDGHVLAVLQLFLDSSAVVRADGVYHDGDRYGGTGLQGGQELGSQVSRGVHQRQHHRRSPGGRTGRCSGAAIVRSGQSGGAGAIKYGYDRNLAWEV